MFESHSTFFIDTHKKSVVIEEDQEEPNFLLKNSSRSLLPNADAVTQPKIVSAWEDEEDFSVNVSKSSRVKKLRNTEEESQLNIVEYESRLRNQFEKLNPKPKWAEASSSKEKDSILSKPFELGSCNKATSLLPNFIDVFRLKNANIQEPAACVIQSVSFHPSSQFLLTAGFDKTLRFFHIDGSQNAKAQSIHLADMPVYKSMFSADGKQAIAVGRRNWFYVCDFETGAVKKIKGIIGRDEKSFEDFYVSPCGRFLVFPGYGGSLMILSAKTKQLITCLKMNGSINSVDFTADGKFMYSFGHDNTVYQWDLDAMKCIRTFRDEGSIKGMSVAASFHNDYVATGSSSGVVNIYQASEICSSDPIPKKSILNLTTPISFMKFHPESEILAIASQHKKNSLRLVHLPSFNVFPNWPTAKTPLGYVSCFDFSPSGKQLAIGNDKGKVLLYQLKHY